MAYLGTTSGGMASIALAALVALPCAAQTAPQARTQGNAEAGATLAESGAQGVPACVSCHGVQAIAGNPQFPLIEGQTQYYLAKQLRDIASSARVSPVMQPIAKALNETQIVDVAAYYATRATPSLKAPAVDAAKAKRGETLALIGDDRIALQACVNCHGDAGRGEPPAVPYVAGQAGGYMVAQLAAFKSGTRRNDEGALMRSAVANISDADMQAVAQYLARVRPAGPLQTARP